MDFLNLIFVSNKIIPCMILVFALTVLLAGQIKKRSKAFYIASGAIALFFVVINIYWNITGMRPEIDSALVNNLMAYVQKGIVGYCLFIIVMFLGVVSKKSPVARKLMAIRGELAIIASIFSLCHLIIFGIGYFIALFTGNIKDIGYTLLFISSALLLVIMIPLWISSFKKIRKRMTPQKWIKLQAYSYYFYFILFGNVIFVFIRRLLFMGDMLKSKPGALAETWLSLAVYTLLFGSYTVLRLKKKSARQKTLSVQNNI